VYDSSRQSHNRTPQRIEIFVDRIEQLFNSMDPSPFHEKDLDHDADEFIVSWAREYPRSDRLALIVHVSQASEGFSQELVEEAMRNYFAYRARLTGCARAPFDLLPTPSPADGGRAKIRKIALR
jgi:hypothetical protein